jgi:hypothetical protein
MVHIMLAMARKANLGSSSGHCLCHALAQILPKKIKSTAEVSVFSWNFEIVQLCSGLFRSIFHEIFVPKIRSFTEDREKFEQIVTFLGSVPLFKKQLPTSELPKVAQMLEEHTWKPDEKLVSQGAMGDLRKIFLRKFQ